MGLAVRAGPACGQVALRDYALMAAALPLTLLIVLCIAICCLRAPFDPDDRG